MSSIAETVPDSVLAAVRKKMGLDRPIPPTLEGLQTVFAAWCRSTGYDNIGLALRNAAGDEGPVPGFPATDYFESWLAFDFSNLCFANSEALRALFLHFGFEVERARGWMGSAGPAFQVERARRSGSAALGSYKHGSLVASLRGEKYLVDPTFMAEHPLHLVLGQRNSAGSGPLRVWTDTDGTICWQIPQGRFNAIFKIEETGCDIQTFRMEHERTKEGLAYGRLYRDKLFVRRNVDGGTLTYDNGAIVAKQGRNWTVTKIGPDALRRALVSDFRISAEAVERIPMSYLVGSASREAVSLS